VLRVSALGHSLGSRPTPSLAFFFGLAVAGQLLDGLTRVVMPDAHEVNPLSVALGGPGSLLAKLGLLAFLAFLAWRWPAERWTRPLLLFAGGVGLVGMASNVPVLT
jgi:hypothetical protein